MASQSAQNRANALNAKIESQAGLVLDDLEKNWLRKVARESFACAVKCYDKAGSSGPQGVLEQCARTCQIPYQQSTNLVQNVRPRQVGVLLFVVVPLFNHPFRKSLNFKTDSIETCKNAKKEQEI
jgi:hypothetical protein